MENKLILFDESIIPEKDREMLSNNISNVLESYDLINEDKHFKLVLDYINGEYHLKFAGRYNSSISSKSVVESNDLSKIHEAIIFCGHYEYKKKCFEDDLLSIQHKKICKISDNIEECENKGTFLCGYEDLKELSISDIENEKIDTFLGDNGMLPSQITVNAMYSLEESNWINQIVVVNLLKYYHDKVFQLESDLKALENKYLTQSIIGK